jgi:PilZ domain-containing protein
MDSTATSDPSSTEQTPTVSGVLAQVKVTWAGEAPATAAGQITAAVVHSSSAMLVLEAVDTELALPPIGTQLEVRGENQHVSGRLAEHGRTGRFLVAIGDRPVRRALRLKVSLPATVRAAALDGPRTVEIVDLTTGGARIRGVELPVGSQVTLDFTPPHREEPVSVRAVVAHGTHRGQQPWIGVLFRLVALRGGR